jgi:hypothetical protein
MNRSERLREELAYEMHTQENMASHTASTTGPLYRIRRTLYLLGNPRLLMATASLTFAVLGFSQNLDTAGWESKLRFHVVSAYGPEGLTSSIVYAGYLQEIDSPREWGQGGAGYGRRLGSTLAYSGVRNALGFGLDSALHQNPRYYRAGGTGLWRRTGHAIRGTILTRTDSGGETFATWRFGSAYSAAFLSNQWRPDRVNTASLSLSQGSTQIGFDLLANLGSEFWPDIRSRIFRRRP